MSPDDFNEYRHLMKEKMAQFDHCRSTHSDELKNIHLKIDEMRKEIILEAKSITTAINNIDKRLTAVEIKSGLWGSIAGACVAILINYLSSILPKI